MRDFRDAKAMAQTLREARDMQMAGGMLTVAEGGPAARGGALAGLA